MNAADERVWAVFVEYLCASGRRWRSHAAAPAEIARAPQRWQTWLARSGLAAWPGYFAERGALPADPRFAEWRAAERQAAVVMRETLAEVLHAFAARAVPAYPLKGAVTAELLYPSAELRPMQDVDVLVAAADPAAVRGAMADLGYASPDAMPPRWNFEWTFVKPGAAAVDVHVALAPQWRIPWSEIPGAAGSAPWIATHARHALAHFAQHKGCVRPIQEFDLLLFERRGSLAHVPAPLIPALRLWNLRRRRFWRHREAGRAGVAPAGPALRLAYAMSQYGGPGGVVARSLAERWLGLLVAARKRGWIGQLLAGNALAARLSRHRRFSQKIK